MLNLHYNFPIKRILCIHNKIRNKLLLITGVMKVLTVTKMVTVQSKIVDLINIQCIICNLKNQHYNDNQFKILLLQSSNDFN